MPLAIDTTHYTLFPLSSGTVVLREGVTQLFLLNETGSLLWQQLIAGMSIEQISQHWVEQFGISFTQARYDITSALSIWQNAGLLGTLPRTSPSANTLVSALFIVLPSLLQLKQVYRVGDCIIKICTDSTLLAQAIDSVFAYLTESTTQISDVTFSAWQQQQQYYLVQDEQILVQNASLDALINHLHYAILQRAIAHNAWLSVLHAGAVSRGDYCLVLAGCGGAGKSTLTASLLARGFYYFCDDLVPLARQNLHAVPVPVPLTIKEPSWSLLQPYYPHLSMLPYYVRNGKKVRYLSPPISTCPATQKVSYLLFPQVSKTTPTLRRLDSLDSLHRLLVANMVLPQPFTATAMTQLLQWLESTPCYEIAYTELNSAIELIEQHLLCES